MRSSPDIISPTWKDTIKLAFRLAQFWNQEFNLKRFFYQFLFDDFRFRTSKYLQENLGTTSRIDLPFFDTFWRISEMKNDMKRCRKRSLTFNPLDPDQIRLTLCYTSLKIEMCCVITPRGETDNRFGPISFKTCSTTTTQIQQTNTHHPGKGIMDLEQYLRHVIPQLLKSEMGATRRTRKKYSRNNTYTRKNKRR